MIEKESLWSQLSKNIESFQWKLNSKQVDIWSYQGILISTYYWVISCKKAGEYGRFYLSIYFSEGKEKENSTANDFKYFYARYVNPYDGEENGFVHGKVIE